MIQTVKISEFALKQLRRLPEHIVDKFYLWKRSVEDIGLNTVRKIPGYHDEVLHGQRKGQRSIRLSKAYRAIYEIRTDGSVRFVAIIEVNKHEY
jgi:proteic killer suppression protein